MVDHERDMVSWGFLCELRQNGWHRFLRWTLWWECLLLFPFCFSPFHVERFCLTRQIFFLMSLLASRVVAWIAAKITMTATTSMNTLRWHLWRLCSFREFTIAMFEKHSESFAIETVRETGKHFGRWSCFALIETTLKFVSLLSLLSKSQFF